MKKFGKILAMVMVALMMMSTIAFADAAIGGTADETTGVVTLPSENVTEAYVVTATLTGLAASEEATILVLKDGVTLSNDIATTDIVYIDQLTTDENGSVTFTFDASAVVSAEPIADVYVDFYCGYTSMTADPLAGTALIYDYEELSSVIYGDADDSGDVGNRDITYIKRYLAGGYDVTINVTAADVDLSGDVGNRDITYIKRYLAGGYDVVLPVQ